MTPIRPHVGFVLALIISFEVFAAAGESASIAALLPSTKETASERRERIDIEVQEILNNTLDDDDYGEATRCIWSNRYDKIELIDERRVIFYGGRSRAWLNHWKHGDQCAGKLYSHYRIGVEQRSRQVCEHDQIFFIDMNMGMRRVGPKCVLGKFEPITREQADYIKDVAGVK